MRTWIGALHHGFLDGIGRLDAGERHERIVPIALALRDAELRLGGNPLHVHPSLRQADTGDGPFIAWANRVRNDPDLSALLEVVLRRASGPWVTNLTSPVWTGETEPSTDGLQPWLGETVRCLLGHRNASPNARGGLVAFHEQPGTPGTFHVPGSEVSIGYWRKLKDLEEMLCQDEPDRSTLETLKDAAKQVGEQVVVLDSALRSAAKWTLDCATHELHRAILGLPVYARALLVEDEKHERMSREEAASVYHRETTIPMSRETGSIGPSRRRERTFTAGPHGPQFFDMHAKPGNLTRVHIHVAEEVDSNGKPIQRIYIGHCGRHLT